MTIKSNSIFFLFIPIVSILFSGCSGSNAIVQSSSDLEYDYFSSILHPKLYTYHSSDDSTRFYYEIDKNEILYTRVDPSFPFQAKVKFHLDLYKLVEGKPVFSDSTSIFLDIDSEKNGQDFIRGSFSHPTASGFEYIMDLETLDMNRNIGDSRSIKLDKTDRRNRQNYLLWDSIDNHPIYEYQKLKTGPLLVTNNRSDEDFEIYDIVDRINFPPPSFSDRKPKFPSLPDKASDTVQNFIEGHSYFITSDPELKKGITFSVRDEFFPFVKTSAKMSETCRYISTKNEYDFLTSGLDTKENIEEFWIDCGGSKNRARQLIKVYYNRVESANFYFSNVIPGWKTDRGLILIVYGKPTRIRKFKDSEIWVYGEEGNINSISFVFNIKKNVYSDENYVLERRGDYKKSWELAVSSWRNGRIYNN